MRTTILILLAVLGGFAAAAATSWRDLRRLSLDDLELAAPIDPQSDPRRPDLAPAGGPQPQAVVETTRFDFGRMERGAKRDHVFQVTNGGEGTLQLSLGDTSCKCTVSGLDKKELQPGESAEVRLEWKAESLRSDFRQTATIFTNDPDQSELRFEIVGQVVESIAVRPEGLYFEKIATETNTYELRVVSGVFDQLDFTGYQCEQPETASNFEVTWRPLTTAELADPELASLAPRSGQLVEITVKPGLPIGAVHQKIVLATGLAEYPEVQLPIGGQVNSDITVVGSGWDERRGVLRLGPVSAAEGKTRQLTVLIRGPHREQTTIEVERTDPPELHASVGVPDDGSRVRQIPLMVEVPAGGRPLSRLGSGHGGYGEIWLRSTHPDAPQLRILVQFAIEQ
ncbi:MAG: DUF1573 domain-containing protein [Pirellulales bacterium]